MFDLSNPSRVLIAYEDFGHHDKGQRDYYFNLFSLSSVAGIYSRETWMREKGPEQLISIFNFNSAAPFAQDTGCREPLSSIVGRLIKQLIKAQNQN
jgi:hypothetical protein